MTFLQKMMDELASDVTDTSILPEVSEVMSSPITSLSIKTNADANGPSIDLSSKEKAYCFCI